MNLGILLAMIAFSIAILVLLSGRTANRRRSHDQEAFSPPSALKRIVYMRPACAEAVGVYKNHSDRQKMQSTCLG